MNYKKGLSLLLTFTMVLTLGLSFSHAETEDTFTDIGGHWAEANIKEAVSLGIVGGYPDGTYLPDNLIKREEFLKLLSNILTEKPDTSNTKIQFTDVMDYEWYVPTIKIAVASGITSGYGDGTFGVGLMISRQEAAKIAGTVIPTYDVENEKGVETALDKTQIADWAYDYVDLMFKKGYMKGDTEGKFRPTMALTRAEAATILLHVKKNEPVIAANADKTATTGCMEAHAGQEGIFIKGSGTKNEPYEIATEEQLNHMKMHATEGAFYILTKNIAITKDHAVTPPAIGSDESNWTEGNFQPLGSRAEPFKGSMDGNEYTISGLNISGTVGRNADKTVASYAGLFGYLAEDSIITELIIDASSIRGNQHTGAIAGYNEGMIKNCQLGKKGIVSGKTNTGGLVGYSTQPLSSLRNKGIVSGTSDNTGGIVGIINATGTALLYCQNDGIVTGNDATGGIAGKSGSAANSASSIQECYNKGTVQSGPYNSGGIVGIANGGITIENCGNTGTVTGAGVSGGIAGMLDNKANVKKCENLGEVFGNSAGGVVGNSQGVVDYCYNSGTVTANLNGGGIAAYQQNGQGRITKCYNEGKVTADSLAGGIIGGNESEIDNCYNAGTVSGTNYIGGIAGQNSGTVTNVYGAGRVTGKNGAGSLVGRNSAMVSNAFWLDGTGLAGIGLSDGTGSQQMVGKLTHDELSGQMKIKTSGGYKLAVDIMNANNKTHSDVTNKTEPAAVWKYLYTTVGAGGTSENNVISDGGGIVPPIGNQSIDQTGNTIDPDDINTKYLYPVIIN